jgi:hypothetical protein
MVERAVRKANHDLRAREILTQLVERLSESPGTVTNRASLFSVVGWHVPVGLT